MNEIQSIDLTSFEKQTILEDNMISFAGTDGNKAVIVHSEIRGKDNISIDDLRIYDLKDMSYVSVLKSDQGLIYPDAYYHMINGNHSPSYKGMEQQAVNSDPMSIAISPLAMPLFAGPGTITTALSLANGGLQNQLITVVAFALLCVITYLLLRSAKQIAGFLGKNLMKIITKMMGLLLFSIGIQMIIVSVQTLLKQ